MVGPVELCPDGAGGVVAVDAPLGSKGTDNIQSMVPGVADGWGPQAAVVFHFDPEAVAVLSPYITQHIIRFGLYQVDRNRQTKPLMYEVPILNPEDTLEVAHVVVGAG
jgi:hypothetical protein